MSNERLKQYFERVQRLEEEKKGISDDIKDIYAEAKSAGYNIKVMKAVIRLSKLTSQERFENDQLTALYSDAIGL